MTHLYSRLYQLVLCLLLLAGVPVIAQDPHPAFRQYTVEDGLLSSKVYQVKQDSKGYMWFATNNGVSRFNGYGFENFSMKDGLPDNTVFEIYEDKKGRIWFVTLTNKLFYYEGGHMHLYRYNHIIDGIKGDHVKTSFCVSESGSVFLGLFGYGIIEITAQGKLIHHVKADMPGLGVAVIEPVPGVLLYVPDYPKKDCSVVSYHTRFLKGRQKLSRSIFLMGPWVRFIRLKNGEIVFSHEGTLFIVDDLKTYQVKEFGERINWIYEDKDNDLWIGTYMGGVYHIKNGDFEHKKNYLKGLFVTGITQDNQGGFWFTTEGNSVYYTPSKEILSYDEVSGLKDMRVNCLASDSDGIYLGLQRPLIQRISSSGAIESYECPPPNKAIVYLAYHKLSGLWFSGNIHAGAIGKNGKACTQIPFSHTKILWEKEGKHWFVNSDGLFTLTEEKRKIPFKMPQVKRIGGILKKDPETLLVGAIDGLWECTISNHTYRQVQPENPILRNRILDLVYANDGSILIATKGAGLLILNKNNQVSQINQETGLSSDNICRILVDGTHVWLATDKGLNRLDMHRSRAWQMKSYTTYDGLISNEIYDIHKFNHRIWAATDKGLSFFDADLSLFNTKEVPLYIDQVMVNDSVKAINTHYQLSYFENNIKIRFIGLSYKQNGKLRYRYKMMGLNEQWSYTQEREIQYTTLPPGNYRFIVSVLHEDGTWGKEASADFSVATPFWKTWWFMVLCGAATISILFFVISYWLARKHKEKSKEAEMNRLLLELKSKALRAQMNPHFIFNVINSIQHFILYNNDEAAHRYLSKFSKLIRTILNNSEKSRVPLSEEIKALNLYLELENMRFENRFEYVIHIDKDIDADQIRIPSMLIQPYVENAIKHGILELKNRRGTIRITLTKDAGLLKCTIEDNGVGRAITLENKLSDYRSFGTSITQQRLAVIAELYQNKLLEKVIDLYDSDGHPMGTRIEVFIPYA